MRLYNLKGLRKDYITKAIMKELGFTYTRKGKLVYQKLKYKRYYELTRNKLRKYEEVTGARKQSVKRYLYNQAQFKRKQVKEGTNRESIISKYIHKAFTGGRYTSKQNYYQVAKATKEYISERYGKLIEHNEYAKKIHEKLGGNSIEELKALNRYIEIRNAKIKEDENGAIDERTIQEGESTDTNGTYDEESYKQVISMFE